MIYCNIMRALLVSVKVSSWATEHKVGLTTWLLNPIIFNEFIEWLEWCLSPVNFKMEHVQGAKSLISWLVGKRVTEHFCSHARHLIGASFHKQTVKSLLCYYWSAAWISHDFAFVYKASILTGVTAAALHFGRHWDLKCAVWELLSSWKLNGLQST